jgi:hypothetical protein
MKFSVRATSSFNYVKLTSKLLPQFLGGITWSVFAQASVNRVLSPSSVVGNKGTQKKISMGVSSGDLGGRQQNICRPTKQKSLGNSFEISRTFPKIVLLLLQRISLSKNLTHKRRFLIRTPFCDTNLFTPTRLHR